MALLWQEEKSYINHLTGKTTRQEILSPFPRGSAVIGNFPDAVVRNIFGAMCRRDLKIIRIQHKDIVTSHARAVIRRPAIDIPDDDPRECVTGIMPVFQKKFMAFERPAPSPQSYGFTPASGFPPLLQNPVSLRRGKWYRSFPISGIVSGRLETIVCLPVHRSGFGKFRSFCPLALHALSNLETSGGQYIASFSKGG